MKGYSSDLYILAFDHRGTLTKGLLGVEGRAPSSDEVARVSSTKDIIFDGFLSILNLNYVAIFIKWIDNLMPFIHWYMK